jgi:hypothetical protein
MSRLNHLEQHSSVRYIDGCLAQLLIEGWVVEKIQVLE